MHPIPDADADNARSEHRLRNSYRIWSASWRPSASAMFIVIVPALLMRSRLQAIFDFTDAQVRSSLTPAIIFGGMFVVAALGFLRIHLRERRRNREHA